MKITNQKSPTTTLSKIAVGEVFAFVGARDVYMKPVSQLDPGGPRAAYVNLSDNTIVYFQDVAGYTECVILEAELTVTWPTGTY